ncbi:zinc/manganese transport system permease protein [Branchiibius hedensis]|uniref:Zinc/manganese transport system permease protein n=1 Tax=Branchiibius hedensis TaxID=672460 RepID=A0A2Y8ZWX1_9MICO|nr:metal ABC transporter permease [Branchiibius hedensis]PWJ27225.1 zinc/manganese transport system permease protein [Branchiibius hedensis]SSA36036.1 zinc/manganese transport system permease protein [Branchiibius hedensis]
MDRIFNFSDYAELLPLVQNSLIAAIALGFLGGLFGTFVMMRDLPFAVHGISELSFAGASAALLFGINVVAGSVIGSLIAAGILGFLGSRARDRNSIIGVLMPFGLGLGVLCLSLYQGRSANKFGLLLGQIVAVDDTQLAALLVGSAIAIVALLIMWRPLLFASVDPEVAQARGVPVRALSLAFMLALGVAVALSIQVVGALLVLSLLVTPAAAAFRVTASPVWAPVLATVFALIAMVGGILLATGASIPISPYVTTLSFLIYLICWAVGRRRSARGWTARSAA